MPQNLPAFSCLTWNIHRCRGNDGVVNAVRTLDVLRDEVWQAGCEALILTEADGDGPPYGGLLDIKQVEAATGLRCIHTHPCHQWGADSHGFVGTIMFVHPSIEVSTLRVLDLPGRVHRGAVVADLERKGQAFRLIGTHLSLMQALRWAQMRIITQHVQRHPVMPNILVGDLNEWRPWGGWAFSHRRFGARFEGPARTTFPVRRPFLALDRVLCNGPAKVASTRVLDGAGIRATSDHRPLWAQVEFENPR